MDTLNRFLAGAFGLILVFLIVDRASGANQVLREFGQQSSNIFRTLQGR